MEEQGQDLQDPQDAARPEWLTLQEFADHYGASTRTVALWVASDPGMRISRVGPACRVIRIHRSELLREPTLS
ncbi:hypothetical protein [Actinacidiphila sp. ITFR-21]|uniref:hypothetical protein n=1 Tax=Actinacidiphila sp. ITFR-21 TaxID=3075199 RepID=UPI00288A4F50|nr:hypothetical protein [Streptomyces sp. ITFR-21]WNI18843.1 hypothetical protein RLT57_27160 [Streptomyces sp. ITFR-21]